MDTVMTAVDLCNGALGRIGQGASRPIQSITGDNDQSEAARACARVFDSTRRAVLAEFNWAFAQAAVVLQSVNETVPGFAAVYAMPTDVIKLHAVGGDDYFPANFHGVSPRFRKLRGANGMVILSDSSPAYAWYTYDAPVEYGDPLFHDAMQWRIAAEISLGLKADPRMFDKAQQQYVLAISKAAAAAANEGGDVDLPTPDTIRLRGQ